MPDPLVAMGRYAFQEAASSYLRKTQLALDLEIGDTGTIVIPRLSKQLFRKHAHTAVHSKRDVCLRARAFLSNAYHIGFGLPQEPQYALYWAALALDEEPAYERGDSYESVIEQLTEHVEALPEIVYAPQIERIRYNRLRKLEEFEPGDYRITPVYRGVSVTLVYKRHRELYHLYDAYSDACDYDLLFHVSRLSTVPLVLGTIGGNITIPDYAYRTKVITGRDEEVITVVGQLCIPKPIRAAVKQHYPEDKLSGLYKRFFADTSERVTFEQDSDLRKLVTQVSEAKSRLEFITDGRYKERLRRNYRTIRSMHRNFPAPRMLDQLHRLRDEYDLLKSGELESIAKFEVDRAVEVHRLAVKETEHEAAIHKYRYLENAFRFVPTFIYAGKEALKLDFWAEHVSSLGFTEPVRSKRMFLDSPVKPDYWESVNSEYTIVGTAHFPISKRSMFIHK